MESLPGRLHRKSWTESARAWQARIMLRRRRSSGGKDGRVAATPFEQRAVRARFGHLEILL